jgi:ferritin-like metal-binding protein YciE
LQADPSFRGTIPNKIRCLSITNIPKPMEDDMAKAKTLEDLFHDTLKDIYYAEKKILKTLPKMHKAAQSPELKAAFEKHLRETQGQVERLNQVFEAIGKKPQAKTCDAIEGIVKEGEGIIEDYKGTQALDAGLISAAQAVEHYEITRYGTLRRWASELGLEEAASLLGESLEEESATDESLTELAEGMVNLNAMTGAMEGVRPGSTGLATANR